MFIASVRLFEFQFVDMHNAYGPADMEIICFAAPKIAGITSDKARIEVCRKSTAKDENHNEVPLHAQSEFQGFPLRQS